MNFYHQLFLCCHLMLKISIQILFLIPSTKKVLKDKLYIYASGWETLTSEHQEYVQFLNNTSLYIFKHDKHFHVKCNIWILNMKTSCVTYQKLY